MEQLYTGVPATGAAAAGSIEFTRGLLSTALTAHRVQAIVVPAWDGPQWSTYTCALQFGYRPEQVEALAGALALAAGAETCRVVRSGGQLLLELAKPAAARRPLAAARLESLAPPAPTAVCLGLASGGLPLWFDLADPRSPHAVIGGTTGSGKTVLLKWLIARLAIQNDPADLRLLLVDLAKSFELIDLVHLVHLVHPIVDTPIEAARVLAWVMAEVERRRANGNIRPRLIVVIEEVADLLAVNRGLGDTLARLCQIGRGLGIHVVATTQQPGAASLGRALANFPVRIIGRVVSSTIAYGAAGRARTDVDRLIGNGDFVYIAAGASARFQAPLPDGRTWSRLPRAEVVATLPDLPPASQIADRNRDPRGGRDPRPLGAADYTAIEAAVRAGATPDDLRRAYGIGYGRAARFCTQIRSLNP